MKKGFLSIVLHAHLPYVRHPEYDSFFEEIWLFEAITECYIPLIDVFDRLQEDKLSYQVTLSLSPTLITMLRDELLQSRYINYLNQRIELAEKEVLRTRKQANYHQLAKFYRRFFVNALSVYQQKYQGDFLQAFKKHYDLGHLELITTAATHGFLPLLNVNEVAVRNQINVGIDTFKSNLGMAPSGFWLPECAYYPGLESLLAEAGIGYFFIDTHGLLDASEQPENNVYAPLDCGNHVMAFARDPESSHQVWSAEAGYPGDKNYREYYSDIGFELDLDKIKPYILDGDKRINTGIKYHRITPEGEEKRLYSPKDARLKADQDAKHFIEKRQQQINSLNLVNGRQPIIVSPYDAELFGHWWYEGPRWLETVLRLADNNPQIDTLSCGNYLKQQNGFQIATPSSSTWGDQGYSSYWINEDNEWLYPLIHKAADEMERLTKDFKGITVSAIQKRLLNQAVRSVLLAQASDWPFIMKSGTTSEYAKKRVTDLLARFNYLHQCIRMNKIDERYLQALEIMDNIFPDIDYRDYYSGYSDS